jgi:hypothetical protein
MILISSVLRSSYSAADDGTWLCSDGFDAGSAELARGVGFCVDEAAVASRGRSCKVGVMRGIPCSKIGIEGGLGLGVRGLMRSAWRSPITC